jgi:hypothetical protein
MEQEIEEHGGAEDVRRVFQDHRQVVMDDPEYEEQPDAGAKEVDTCDQHGEAFSAESADPTMPCRPTIHGISLRLLV